MISRFIIHLGVNAMFIVNVSSCLIAARATTIPTGAPQSVKCALDALIHLSVNNYDRQRYFDHLVFTLDGSNDLVDAESDQLIARGVTFFFKKKSVERFVECTMPLWSDMNWSRHLYLSRYLNQRSAPIFVALKAVQEKRAAAIMKGFRRVLRNLVNEPALLDILRQFYGLNVEEVIAKTAWYDSQAPQTENSEIVCPWISFCFEKEEQRRTPMSSFGIKIGDARKVLTRFYFNHLC